MLERSFASVAMAAALVGSAVGIALVASPRVPPAEGVPAFARQYDLQCNACHTRPPRLNRFGEQFHIDGLPDPQRRSARRAARKPQRRRASQDADRQPGAPN